jgi:hypothetical protein
MSGYGKLNLLGMLVMPVVATMAVVVISGPRIDTMLTVFGMNAVPMLLAGLFSALLLRGANKAGGVGRGIALWPTMIPAAIGVTWYLWDALFPAELDPGRVYIAGPIYLVLWAFVAGFVSWIACIVVRSRRDKL